MNPFAFIEALWAKGLERIRALGFYFRPPDPSADPACAAEAAWVADYQSTQQVPGPVVLEHARARYAEVSQCFESLNQSADRILRTAGLLAAVELAAVGAFHVLPGWPIRLSLASLVASMLAIVWSRRPTDCPMPPRIRDVLEGIDTAENPEAWLAASYHGAVEALKVTNHWKAGWLGFACLLLSLAAAWLLPAALTA